MIKRIKYSKKNWKVNSWKNKKPKKSKKKVGLYIITTLNNFYLVCVDLASAQKRVLTFMSGGLIKSYGRFNRKKYRTVEMAARRISFFLKQHKIKTVVLVLRSHFRKKFLRSICEGLRYHKIFFNEFYDRRRLAHNGCLKPKKRRL